MAKSQKHHVEWKKPDTQKHAEWFLLDKGQEQVKLIKLGDRIIVVSGYSCVCRGSRKGYHLEEDKRDFLGPW